MGCGICRHLHGRNEFRRRLTKVAVGPSTTLPNTWLPQRGVSIAGATPQILADAVPCIAECIEFKIDSDRRDVQRVFRGDSPASDPGWPKWSCPDSVDG